MPSICLYVRWKCSEESIIDFCYCYCAHRAATATPPPLCRSCCAGENAAADMKHQPDFPPGVFPPEGKKMTPNLGSQNPTH